ncbi:TPA: hypothetical protein DCW54_00165 [Candidatus Dependentiae bacterium]|nr:hypothetical protein [Candidatus Dependentiae bacterium]
MTGESEKLSLATALTVGLNAAVGAGVFSAPIALYRTAGPIGITAYLLTTVLILFIGLAFTKLLQKQKSTSFLYDFPALWGGKVAGTISLILYSSGLVVALGLLGKIAGELLALVSNCANPTLWGVALILATALGSQMGTAWLTWGQYILFLLTVIPMLIISTLGLRFGSLEKLFPVAPHGISSILWALPIVAFGFFGFEAIPALFSRIKNPEKNAARAIIATIVITGALYMLFVGSIFYLLPESAYQEQSLGAALLSVLIHYQWLVAIINWAIIITIAGTLYSMFPAITNLICQAQKMISQQITALIIPIGAIIIMVSANNVLTLFNLTALGIAGSYGMTTYALLTKSLKPTLSELLIGALGCIASLILCLCALMGLW